MPNTTQDLGMPTVSGEPLIAGLTTEVILAVKLSEGDEVKEVRVVKDILALGIISYQGPEIEGDIAVFRLQISPSGQQNKVEIKVNFTENSPSNKVVLPVNTPTVTTITPRKVKTGTRRFVINGHFLQGCSVEITNDVGEIVWQKSYNNRVEVDIKLEEEKNCSLRVVYGQETRSIVSIPIDLPPLMVEFKKPAVHPRKSRFPFGMVFFTFISFIICLILLCC